MDCEQVEREELIERYLRAELSAPEADAFEQHYFDCPRCLEKLQAMRSLQSVLASDRVAIEAGSRRPGLVWPWAWVAAAGLVLVIGLSFWFRQASVPSQMRSETGGPAAVSPPASQQLDALRAELLRVEPPPYSPPTLRGTTDDATQRFREAMKLYQAGDYSAAIPALRQSLELDSQSADSRFFLGICHLLTGEAGKAIAELRRTVALGDSPYLEEAHFYLAKAHLQENNLTAAKSELQKMIQLRGDRETEGREFLKKVEALIQAPRE